MRTIALLNQKGGTAKTTSAINLAGELVRRGKKVLIVDMDTQGNATSNLNLVEIPEQTLTDVIVSKIRQVLQEGSEMQMLLLDESKQVFLAVNALLGGFLQEQQVTLQHRLFATFIIFRQAVQGSEERQCFLHGLQKFLVTGMGRGLFSEIEQVMESALL